MGEREIKQKLKELPDSPGVYLMYNAEGVIIYIGKAKVLKNRVRSYFMAGEKPEKVAAMVSHIDRFEYFIAPSELDALVLEANLVKKHKPHYNILLKDDKSLPYIRINVKEDFPQIEVTRRVKRDGARYFGPYLGGVSVWQVVEIIKSAYRLRSCENMQGKSRACLNYHIDLCLAPCIKKVSREEYRAAIEKVIGFLNGRDDDALRLLEERMRQATAAEEFERAIRYRDQLTVLDAMKQKVVASLTAECSYDIFAFWGQGRSAAICAMFVRAGKLTGVKNYPVGDAGLTAPSALSGFMREFYAKYPEFPDEILLSELPEDADALAEWIRDLAGRKTPIICPERGVKRKLTDAALLNARDCSEKNEGRAERKEELTIGAVRGLKTALMLERLPRRIECFDISNISGVDKVASMAVFWEGEPLKTAYRRFKIKTVEGADDFASMRETLCRRLMRLRPADNGKEQAENERFGAAPDLILIDGGAGQLSSAQEAMEAAGTDIPMAALAEREELLYLPGGRTLRLPMRSPELLLLIRIRDEAHRFAVSYHRSLREKKYESGLLKIPGLGKARIKSLYAAFKSIDAIKKAGVGELKKVKGLPESAARAVYEYFHKDK